ncbi:MAG: enolase C-terminal domain-like protein [Nitrososphaeria archaeon]
MSSKIKIIFAREIMSIRGHPGIETTVVTEDGSSGTGIVQAGVSVGEHEVFFIHDGGKRYNGLGLTKAVDIVNNVIAPKLVGFDIIDQNKIDDTMIKLDGTPLKTKLGGNSTASISAACLKAAANFLHIPLYQHIGGVFARILPVPGVAGYIGGTRYGGGQRSGEKPSVTFMAYGFKTFSEASYACWELKREFYRIVYEKLGQRTYSGFYSMLLVKKSEKIKHDRQLWEIMAETIENLGYKNRVGIQMDVAAGTYWDKNKKKFVGLFSAEDKTPEDLIELYKEAVKDYPFLVLEDPMDENDVEGHAILTKELGIQIVGDDFFTTNIERVKRGIEGKACNTVLLKVNQIGSITEAFEMVEYAYKHGYAVMPCSSRGEGADIADYAVGLNTGQMREGGLDDTTNRVTMIEKELGSRGQFMGKAAFKTRSFLPS